MFLLNDSKIFEGVLKVKNAPRMKKKLIMKKIPADPPGLLLSLKTCQ